MAENTELQLVQQQANNITRQIATLKFWKLNHSNNFPSPKTTMFTKMKYNSCLANIPFFVSSLDASEANIRIGTEHTAETANICQSIFTLICASNPPKTEIKTVAAINTPNVTLPKISINIFNFSAISSYLFYNPSRSFKTGTYCLEIIVFSPLSNTASKRPPKAGDKLFTLFRFKIADFDARINDSTGSMPSSVYNFSRTS